MGVFRGITYVNDSKATNLASAASALSWFERIYWIMGGRAKDVSMKQFGSELSRVVHTFTIGEAGEAFGEMLEDTVPVTNSKNLATAVDQATKLALSNADSSAVVLLSPGCASFDQFANFEARGITFCNLVTKLRESATLEKQSIVDEEVS